MLKPADVRRAQTLHCNIAFAKRAQKRLKSRTFAQQFGEDRLVHWLKPT
jgi:hypothetical protein